MYFKANHVLPIGVFTKILRIFKLTFVLVLVVAQLSAKGYSQKLTLNEKNASIRQIFHDIWKQSGIQFVYTNEVLQGAKPVTVIVKAASLEEVLGICFKDQPFTYTIADKAIVVKRLTHSSQQQPVVRALMEVHGYVTDTTGKPLPDVSVVVKGTKIGTTTNHLGAYQLSKVPEDGTLVFSFVGMLEQEVEVHGMKSISVTLKVQPSDLDQIVVVGYGTQKKEFLTAAISTVSGAELVKAPVANISTALKGQLAGLVALQSSGKPGSDGATLTIRGIGTYTGQTAPLIMVDGIARDTYDDIDPNEVESISVLKDASATAVYGVRGANGVILITTKRGKIGAPKISLSGQTAITEFTNMPEFVGSFDYATMLNEQSFETYWINHAGDADIHTWDDFIKKRSANWKKEANIYYSDQDLLYYKNVHTPKLTDGSVNPNYDPYFHPDVNWVDKIFKKFTPMSQANANITGGTKFMRYFVSLGYLNQGGLFKTDYLTFPDEMEFKKNRYNLRGNFDFDVTEDFKVSVNLAAQFVMISGMDNDQYTWEKRILWSTPLASPGIIDGKYVVPFNNQNDQLNPMYALENSNNYNITNNSILNSSVVFTYKLDKLTKGLSVKGLGSYDSYFSSASGGNNKPLWYGIRENPNGDKLDPILVQLNDATPPQRWGDYFNGKWRKLYGEVSMNYDRTFGKHAISGLVLGSKEKKYDPDLQYDLPHAYESLAGRVHYGFANKYIAEFDMGYNGSENFPEGKRFGFFPSYSGAWIISNESFYPKNDLISFLKLRGSYGKVGNDNIGGARYLYLPDTWKYEGGYNFGDLDNRNYIQGADENV
ncbi:MAG TPA: SusC/RagA family TonB-linked outer membrane protein, partial [Arachidicoccus sp.]|nr:SusC/RagA family TonB-linked outer membrane protein [Arachidicoccus sp.]